MPSMLFSRVINLYSRKPDGLFSLLNDNAPGQSDSRLLTRFTESNEGESAPKCAQKVYQRNELTAAFSICHYAGWVEYNIGGFLEKNRDVVASGSLQVLRSSHCWLMRSACAQNSRALWRWRQLHRCVQAAAAFRKKYANLNVTEDESDAIENKIDRGLKMLDIHQARNSLPQSDVAASRSQNGRTTTSLQYQQVKQL